MFQLFLAQLHGQLAPFVLVYENRGRACENAGLLTAPKGVVCPMRKGKPRLLIVDAKSSDSFRNLALGFFIYSGWPDKRHLSDSNAFK